MLDSFACISFASRCKRSSAKSYVIDVGLPNVV